ncbi:MAG: cPA2 [Deltaproteobacteria bacterium]|nr:cPA2 [Deltaproteobacteria bacterium]
MENIPLLKDLVILMAVSVPVTIIFHRLGLPAIIGFIITGIIIGPYGTGLVTNLSAVDTLAQIGVILLLFVVGLEFSMTKMFRLRKEALLGGGLQVAITSALALAGAYIVGYPGTQSLFISFVTALSSTAIVLKLLADRGELDTPQGSLSMSILLFQDICVVPMIIILQAIASAKEVSFLSIANPLLFAAAAVGVILAASYILVPRILYQVVKLRNREVFTLTVLLLCFGTAWITSYAGLSLALGAFIAGLVISESEYSHQIVAEVLSFRDTFMSLFFVSIGMLLDLGYFTKNIPHLFLLASGVIILKVMVVVGIGQMLKTPIRLSIIVGMSIAQIGEFSFVLMKLGEDSGLLAHDLYQTLLAASILTMSATPFLMQISHAAAYRAAHLLGVRAVPSTEGRIAATSDHVIIVGYGLNGQNLAKVLKEIGIKYIILDMNWTRIKLARKDGHKALFGDASHIEILKNLYIDNARMMVIAISDPAITRRMVKIAREANDRLYILVRTHYISEVEELYKLGANQVIPEEFETSVEIFSRVLKEYHIPGNIIQNQIDIIRNEGYAMFRTPSLSREKLMEITSILSESVIETFFVNTGSHLIGKTLAEIDLRKKSGVMVLAIVRKATTRANPPADLAIEEGDILAIIGSHAEMDSAIRALKGD